MKIICVGNPFIASDSLGPRVYAALAESELPAGVELVDGGLAGLDLLRFVSTDPLIFVDGLCGFGNPGELIVLNQAELEHSLPAQSATTHYDHAAGLAYLLRVIPILYPQDQAAPKIWLVGTEVNGEQPPSAADIAQTAMACLRLAAGDQPAC